MTVTDCDMSDFFLLVTYQRHGEERRHAHRRPGRSKQERQNGTQERKQDCDCGYHSQLGRVLNEEDSNQGATEPWRPSTSY